MNSKWIVLIVLLLVLTPSVLGLESKDVYDINDRQTKELKAYIDTKITATVDETKKFTDNLFVTFDGKMRDLTKNFVIQMVVVMFCAILLANLITEAIRSRHEKKLMEYKYNILLEKEVDVRVKVATLVPKEEGKNIPIPETLPKEKPLPEPPTPPSPIKIEPSIVMVHNEVEEKRSKAKRNKVKSELEDALEGVE